jgi:hypothetical protein
MSTAQEAPEAIDAAKVREITLEVLATAAKIAALTPTPLDDQIVGTAINIVNKDLVWNLVVRFILRQVPEAVPGEMEAMAALVEDAAPGIDPLTIIALIQSLIPTIQAFLAWWKKRRNVAPTPAPTPVV